jgi:tetratricopeptide (TPR) repeat protein
LIDAYYNLGAAQRLLGNSAEARNSYYRVVDGAPGSELTPLAYLRIGRLFLDEGDAEHAIPPLRRAAAAGAGTSTQPVAALALAAAYILTNHPRAANAVLTEHRTPLAADAYRALSAFLDALARYHELGDHKHGQREGAELLGALLGTENSNLLGPVENLLAAEAYGDLGMGEQKMQLYEKLARGSKGALAAQSVNSLAEFLFAANEREAAKRLFASLVASAKGDVAAHARYRLAELALKEMRPAECLELCRDLMRDKAPVEMTPLLKMIGTAFEQLGQHRQAALCFAGQLPDDFAARPVQPPKAPAPTNGP